MNLRKIFLVVLTVMIVYSAVTMALPWVKNALFQFDIDEAIKEVGPSSLTAVRGRLEYEIRTEGLPISPEQLETSYDPATGKVVIQARYSVTVSTPLDLYTHTWEFHPYAERIVPMVPGSQTLF